jgi:hypothetical protein
VLSCLWHNDGMRMNTNTENEEVMRTYTAAYDFLAQKLGFDYPRNNPELLGAWMNAMATLTVAKELGALASGVNKLSQQISAAIKADMERP